MNSDHWYTGRQPTRTPTLNHSEFLAGLHAPEWMSQGICAQTDPEAWFPEKGGSTGEAKTICGTCDVRAECLAYAIDHGERFGIWGGLSERERRHLKNNPTARPRPCLRDDCAELIPATAHASKRYHDKTCARIDREEALITTLDTGPILEAYLEAGDPIGTLATRHHLQQSVIIRILDQHGIDHTRAISHARRQARQPVAPTAREAS